MTSFEAVVEYAGTRVKIAADTFAELHQALAGVEELNRDADFLREQGIEEIVPVYRRDADDNEYFGFQDRYSRRNVSFGKKREGGLIPFFPKGAEGYYDPTAQRASPAPQEDRTAHGRRPQRNATRSARQERP